MKDAVAFLVIHLPFLALFVWFIFVAIHKPYALGVAALIILGYSITIAFSVLKFDDDFGFYQYVSMYIFSGVMIYIKKHDGQKLKMFETIYSITLFSLVFLPLGLICLFLAYLISPISPH